MLTVGVIGLGVGAAHLEAFSKHPNVRVLTVADFSAEKLHAVRQAYPKIETTTQADKVLEDPNIQAVSIASYDSYHHSQILKALEHEKHVFVEKPFCTSVQQAVEIRKALTERPHVCFSSNLILRKCPRFEWLRKAIQRGDFGRLFYLEGDYNYGRLHKLTEGWRGDEQRYSVVYGGAVHLIDLLLWLSNDEVIEVQGYGNGLSSQGTKFRFNDLAVALLKFKSGVIGKVSANFACVQPHFHGVIAYGTQATFVNGRDEGIFYTSRDSNAQPQAIREPYPVTDKGLLVHNFVENILGNEEPIVTRSEVFGVMSVCFAIEEAIEKRSPVSVIYY